MEDRMPVFVKVEEYKEVLDQLNEIKAKVEEMNATLDALDELKEQEDNEIDSWRAGIEDVENKLHYIDQTLFEPENL
jgi:chromosome segregation ATPase